MISARQILKVASLGAMIVAALAMAVAVIVGEAEVGLYRLALTAWLVAATTYMSTRTGITAKVLELARQGGYDAGYDVGRRASRPVVVPFRSAGLKPALHLSEQNIVRRLSKDGS